MKRYEIYWARLDPVEGSELGKTRPCVIVSLDSLNAISPHRRSLPAEHGAPAPLADAVAGGQRWQTGGCVRRPDSRGEQDAAHPEDRGPLRKRRHRVARTPHRYVWRTLTAALRVEDIFIESQHGGGIGTSV